MCIRDSSDGEVGVVEVLATAQSAGAEDIYLHQLVSDNVQSDEEHAVFDQLGLPFITNIRTSPSPASCRNSYGSRRSATSPRRRIGDRLTPVMYPISACLLYTSDAADDLTRVDLGGRRF